MAEEFLDKVLHDENVKLNHVLHLGAEWAQETEVYNKYGAEHVYWVEPILQNRSIAEYHYLSKAKFEWTFIPSAVADENKNSVFYLYNHQSANSLFKPDRMNVYYPGHKVASQVLVRCNTLDTIFDEFEVDYKKINLLCMDIQGAEMMALNYAHQLLKSPLLKYICAEVVWEPLYKDGCLKSEIDNLLAEYKFFPKYEEQHNPTYEGIKEVPQSDIMYVRV